MPTANFTKSRARIAPAMCKLESTYGTDPTPAAATDDLNTIDSTVVVQPTASRYEVNPHRNSFTHPQDVITMRMADVTLKTVLMTSGSNGTIAVNGFAGLDALLSSAACTSTASAMTSIAYKASTIAAEESATLWVNHHGYIHKVNGMKGNVIVSGNARSTLTVDYKGRGLYAAPVAVSTTFNSWAGGTMRHQPCLGITATINNGSSFTPVIRSFTHDWGVQLGEIDNMNSSTGLEEIFVVNRQPTLELVIAQDTYGSATITYDEWFTDWLSSGPTTHNIDWTVGATTNAIAFNFPTAQLVQPNIRENGGVRDLALQYKLMHATAESEWDYLMGA